MTTGNEIVRTLLFMIGVGVLTTGLYFVFFSGERDETYIYWDATVTFVWIDASESTRDYATGRGRYEVRLPFGRHVEARTFLVEQFNRYDCVRLRQVSFSITAEPTYEIVGRANECWQPP